MLLLGPVPGLVAGVFLIFYLRVHPSPLWRLVAVSLITINAFNLLPIAPLDGGQFFRLLVFSRNRFLEVAFAALAGAALVVWGLKVGGFFLPLIGLAMILGLPRLNRTLRAAKDLRAKYGTLPADPALLQDGQCRDLFLVSRSVTGNALRKRPRDGAVAMEQVLERTVSRSPSIAASVVLLLPWVTGVYAAFLGVVGLALTSTPNWQMQAVPQGGFSIKLPHRSPISRIKRDTPLGNIEMSSIDTTGTSGIFDIRWYDLPASVQVDDERADKEFLDRSRDSDPLARKRDAGGRGPTARRRSRARLPHVERAIRVGAGARSS